MRNEISPTSAVVFTSRVRWKSVSSLSRWRRSRNSPYIREGIIKGKEKRAYLAFCAIYPGSQVPLRVLSLPHSIHLSLFSTIKKTLPCSSGRKVTGGCRRPPFSPSTTSAGIKTSLNTPVPTTAGSVLWNKALVVKLIKRHGETLPRQLCAILIRSFSRGMVRADRVRTVVYGWFSPRLMYLTDAARS